MKNKVKYGLGRLMHFLHGCHDVYLEHCSRQGFLALGENVQFSKCNFGRRDRIRIGNDVYIGGGSSVDGTGGVSIEDYAILSSDVVILSSMHNFDSRVAKMIPYDEVELLKPVRIGRACWVGIRAIILPGVHLGDGCIVGAGSVVTKSWPAGTILAGSPAKPIDQRNMKHFNECAARGDFYMLQKRTKKLVKSEQVA